MKTIIRSFFQILRIVLGPVMLLRERLMRPAGIERTPAAQAAVDLQCKSLALYQFSTCPFCIKVRQEMRRLSLNVELRDAQHNTQNKADLAQSGSGKVPCLQITDASGQVQWLPDSGAIIAYLNSRFAQV